MSLKLLETFLNEEVNDNKTKSGKPEYDNFQKQDYIKKINELKIQTKMLKGMLEKQPDENLEQYLSDKEKETLQTLNKISNTLNTQDASLKDIMNQPIGQIIKNWSTVHQEILKDIVGYVQNSNIQSKVTQKNWWTPITTFIYDIIRLCIINNRMFYLGLTVVFIGLIFVFVNISE